MRQDPRTINRCWEKPDTTTHRGMQRHISCQVLEYLEVTGVRSSHFAALAGMDQAQLRNRLHGMTNWALFEVYCIARAMGIDVRELLPPSLPVDNSIHRVRATV